MIRAHRRQRPRGLAGIAGWSRLRGCGSCVRSWDGAGPARAAAGCSRRGVGGGSVECRSERAPAASEAAAPGPRWHRFRYRCAVPRPPNAAAGAPMRTGTLRHVWQGEPRCVPKAFACLPTHAWHVRLLIPVPRGALCKRSPERRSRRPRGPTAALAAAPRPATLAGARLLRAGRLGPGLLVVREAAAMAPPVRKPGVVWDGRFAWVPRHGFRRGLRLALWVPTQPGCAGSHRCPPPSWRRCLRSG